MSVSYLKFEVRRNKMLEFLVLLDKKEAGKLAKLRECGCEGGMILMAPLQDDYGYLEVFTLQK